MRIKTLIILLVLFILSLSANAGSTGVKPNPAYVNQELEFYISLDDSLNSDYGILLQLGDGGGGWSSDKIMTSKYSNSYFYYKRSISQAGVNRKWRYTAYRLSDGAKVKWYEKTYTVSEAPTPQVETFNATPSTPKMFESIEFEATTDLSVSNVKFKCGGGSWQSSSSSNSGKTWKYTRDVGLKGNTTCYVDIDGDGTSDKSLSLNVSDPRFTISKSINSPKVQENVKFTVTTDRIKETAYKVQVKFSTNWFDMSASSNRNSWTYDRKFNSSGNKTVYFRIVDSSNTSLYSTSTSLSVDDVIVVPKIKTFNATPSTPKMFESIEFEATTDLSVSNVKFKCGGGSWQSSSSSNSGKTWKYTRDVGLKGNTTCYVDIDGDGTSDKSLSLNVSDPRFTISKSINSPKVEENVRFTVATDKIESGYTVQVKFSTNGDWSNMSPTSNRDSWEFDRVFETTGSKDVNFRIVNSSFTSFYDTSISFSVANVDSVITSTVTGITPLTATQNIAQDYTITGTNLPSTIVGNIEGTTTSCSIVTHSLTTVVMNCNAEVIGSKRFYLKNKSGGTTISGSENIYVEVNEVTQTDTKPTITIKTAVTLNGSTLTASVESIDDNKLEKVFFSIFDENNNKIDIQNNISVVQPSLVAYTGDLTLVAVANNSQQFNSSSNSDYSYSYGYTPTYKNETTNWNINISNLNDGKYYIKFYADDGVENHITQTDSSIFIKSTLVNGVCGTANNYVFSSRDTNFGEKTLCKSGTAIGLNEEAPKFPNVRETVTWVCFGEVEGTSETCSASRNDDNSNPILHVKNKLYYHLPLLNTKLSLTLWAEDIDASYIQVDWYGDGSDVSEKQYVGNNERVTFTKTYPKIAGKTYTWTATAYDSQGHTDTKSGTVTIGETWLITDATFITVNGQSLKYFDGMNITKNSTISKQWNITNSSGLDWSDYGIYECGSSASSNCSKIENISLANGKSFTYTIDYTPDNLGLFKKYYQIRNNDNYPLASQGNNTISHFWVEINVVNPNVNNDEISNQINDKKNELGALNEELDTSIANNLHNVTNDLRSFDDKLYNFKDTEQTIKLSHAGNILNPILKVRYAGYNSSTLANYPAFVRLEYTKNYSLTDGNINFPKTQPWFIVNNKAYLEAVVSQASLYMESSPTLNNICSNQLSGGVCISSELESIITEEAVKDISEAIHNKYPSLSAKEVALATKEGVLKAGEEILNDYKDTPEDLTNAITGVFSFTINLITDPSHTINAGIDKLEGAKETVAMVGSEIGEIAKNIPDLVANMNPRDKVYYTAYLTTHLAHEFAPTSKLKLLKLTKLDNFTRPLYLSKSKLLKLAKEQGYPIKLSVLKYFSKKDWEVFGEIYTKLYKKDKLIKEEYILLNLISKNNKKEFQKYLTRMWIGNRFNKLRKKDFDANEVYILTGKPKPNQYVRLDSYNTKREPMGIFSRKDTQLRNISKETAKRYLDELAKKYPVGAVIADVPSSNKYNPPLAGKTLKGQLYLEVPVQKDDVPTEILDYAKNKRIIIRDINGKKYNEI